MNYDLGVRRNDLGEPLKNLGQPQNDLGTVNYELGLMKNDLDTVESESLKKHGFRIANNRWHLVVDFSV